ncbi:MAG: MBL fold metallo-hydrolase [Candidatus Paceibacterota bacterium]|jgi:hypothetical protein
MIITYNGMGCVKVTLGERVLAFNPASKDSKVKTPRFGADVAMVSLNHPDYNGLSSVTKSDGTTLAIYGPGEYESGGVYIKGIGVEEIIYGKKMINTIYSVSLDEINICHLGALNISELKSDAEEAIGNIDILFVPLGGDLLDSSGAEKIISTLEPKIVIPLYHGQKGEAKNQLDGLIKEIGDKNTKPIDKLVVKKKDLDGKDGELIVLEPALS